MIQGPAIVLGDDVNTDELHPSCFYSLNDDRVRDGFLRAVEGREGDADQNMQGKIIVGGRNFGIGSSRETGARVFLLAGIQAVVAVSFARIFHRNVLNLGLPALACPALAEYPLKEGTILTVDLSGGQLLFEDTILSTKPLDPHWKNVLQAGGLAPYLGLEPIA